MHRQRFLCEQGYEYAIVDAEARHAAAGARKPATVRLRHVDWNGVFAVARRRVAAWTGSFAGIGVLPVVRGYGFRP